MESIFILVITITSGVAAIAAFLVPEYRIRRARKLNCPRLHRFTSNSPESLWKSFREVHEQRFPDEEISDSYVDIRRWIDEWTVARRHPSHDMEEILLGRCIQSRVRSYVYAQYYKSSRFGFISYIATDKRAKEAVYEDMGSVLEGLLALIREYDPNWKAIIGELEETRIVMLEGRKRKQRHAEILFRLFMDASENLRKKSGVVIPIYSFTFPYYQPVLRPEEVPEDGSVVVTPELKQWILYVPNGPEAVIERKGKIFVPQERAIEVLEFIFLRLYRDAFLAPKYQQYLRSSLAYHKRQLAGEVRLATNPLEAAGREA